MIDEKFKKEIVQHPALNQIIQGIRTELLAKGFDKKASLKQTLQLLEANELILRDFLLNTKHCEPGPMSACQQTNIGFENQISYHNGKFYLDLTYCNHWKLAHRQELRQKYLIHTDYNLNDLPEDINEAKKLLQLNATALTTTTNNNRIAFINQSWELLLKKATKGLYLVGPPDSSKTFLFRILANSWAAQEQSQVALVKVPKLINDCRGLIQKKANEKHTKLLNSLKRVDVLFLDEFGAESISRWSRDEILGEILNYRDDQAKLTFINSNFSWTQLRKHYVLPKEISKIEQIRVNRFLSRLRRLTRTYNLLGAHPN